MFENGTESEKLILEEVERTRNILEKQIDKVQKNLEELSQYYRITKLENDDTADSYVLFDGGISRVWVKDIFITDTI